MSNQPKKARWWYAWRPVRTADTNRIVWCKTVWREQWYETLYFENPKLEKIA